MLKQFACLSLGIFPAMVFSASCYDANYDASKGIENNTAFVSCVVNQTNDCYKTGKSCSDIAAFIRASTSDSAAGITKACDMSPVVCGKLTVDCTKDLNYWKNQLHWSCNPSFTKKWHKAP